MAAEPGVTPEEEPEVPTKDDPDAGAKSALVAERKARRDAEKQATELAARLAELEDKDKTEVQRLTDENARLTKELGTATVTGARLKVALDKGLTATQAKRLVGDTEEDLAADADELLIDLGPRGDGEQPRPAPPGGKPREQLKPGSGDPDAPVEETDVKALGERMFRS